MLLELQHSNTGAMPPELRSLSKKTKVEFVDRLLNCLMGDRKKLYQIPDSSSDFGIDLFKVPIAAFC